MKINNIYSPNFNRAKRSKKSIKIIVIHYTGMQSERESIIRLCNPQSKASSHFLINQNGKVYRLVQDNRIAWHAGKSCWKHYKNLNKNSIGIELVNKGHRFGYTNFRKKQLLSLIKICKTLIKRYKIKKKKYSWSFWYCSIKKNWSRRKISMETIGEKKYWNLAWLQT